MSGRRARTRQGLSSWFRCSLAALVGVVLMYNVKVVSRVHQAQAQSPGDGHELQDVQLSTAMQISTGPLVSPARFLVAPVPTMGNDTLHALVRVTEARTPPPVLHTQIQSHAETTVRRNESRSVTGSKRPVVAYAVTVTKDSKYVDGAAVLGHAISLAHRKSNFDFALVALVHPEVTSAILQSSGVALIVCSNFSR